MPRVRAILPPVSVYPRTRKPMPILRMRHTYSTDTAKSASASRTSICQRLRRCAISALTVDARSLTIPKALTAMVAASG